MLSKKLIATLGVLTATALAPATVAHAAPSPAPTDAAHVRNLGTQVGSEGVRAPQANGIIAILIGLVSSPPASDKGPVVPGLRAASRAAPRR